MKYGIAIFALVVSIAGCSHKPAHSDEAPASTAAVANPAPTQTNDDGTTSAATTSLGAATSGRGH